MDEARLSAIEQRDKARTPGQWEVSAGSLAAYGQVWSERSGRVATCHVDDDAAFIAACSVDVPDLAKEVRRCWDIIKGFEEAEKDRTVARHRLMAEVVDAAGQLLNSDEFCDQHIEQLGRAYKRLELFDEKEANRAE